MCVQVGAEAIRSLDFVLSGPRVSMESTNHGSLVPGCLVMLGALVAFLGRYQRLATSAEVSLAWKHFFHLHS